MALCFVRIVPVRQHHHEGGRELNSGRRKEPITDAALDPDQNNCYGHARDAPGVQAEQQPHVPGRPPPLEPDEEKNINVDRNGSGEDDPEQGNGDVEGEHQADQGKNERGGVDRRVELDMHAEQVACGDDDQQRVARAVHPPAVGAAKRVAVNGVGERDRAHGQQQSPANGRRGRPAVQGAGRHLADLEHEDDRVQHEQREVDRHRGQKKIRRPCAPVQHRRFTFSFLQCHH